MQHNFERLSCWVRARALVKQIYLLTQNFPSEERFGLTSQMRRSAVSIPSNIAEGCGRGTEKALVNFLNIANGSSTELETQLFLALDLAFIDEETFIETRQEVIEVRKLILGFKRFILKNDPKSSNPPGA